MWNPAAIVEYRGVFFAAKSPSGGLIVQGGVTTGLLSAASTFAPDLARSSAGATRADDHRIIWLMTFSEDLAFHGPAVGKAVSLQRMLERAPVVDLVSASSVNGLLAAYTILPGLLPRAVHSFLRIYQQRRNLAAINADILEHAVVERLEFHTDFVEGATREETDEHPAQSSHQACARARLSAYPRQIQYRLVGQ